MADCRRQDIDDKNNQGPKERPRKNPDQGCQVRCTPPKNGRLTWNIANEVAVKNAAIVIVLVSGLFFDRSRYSTIAMITSAQVHQTRTQNRVKEPSSR